MSKGHIKAVKAPRGKGKSIQERMDSDMSDGVDGKQVRDMTLWLFDRCMVKGYGPPASDDELVERARDYYDKAMELDCTPSKPALALALGYGDALSMTLATQDDTGGNTSAYRLTLKNVIHLAETATLEYASRGRVGCIFLLKSSFLYVEAKQQTEISLPGVTFQLNFGVVGAKPADVVSILPPQLAAMAGKLSDNS